MCGIAGAINFRKKLRDSELNQVKHLSSCLEHRGPDASGFFKSKNVSFSHRRLSIIDLNENSNQPMHSQDQDITIVYNGEIYNHSELRKILKKKYFFKTNNSDTEVIINAYKEWGIDCLEKFIGFFAIAIYDKNKEKVFLIRDRLGKKPIYYTKINGTLYFGSENQSFFKCGLLKKEYDDESIYHYLSYLSTPAPKTFFKNVKKIQAGHYIEISENNFCETKYWDIAKFINKPLNTNFKNASKKTDLLLKKSMEYRNVSDVPISIALSGGIDSSLNLNYSKNFRNDNIAAINISFEKTTEGNEKLIAQKFALEKNVDFVSKELEKNEFTNWIKNYLDISNDVPAGDPNAALIYGISKIAKNKGYKVLIVGEGGDEIGGYPVYKILPLIHKFHKYTPKFMINFLLRIIPKNKYTKRLLRGLSTPDYVSRFLFGFSEDEKKKFWKKKSGYNSYDFLEKFANEIKDNYEDSFLRKVLNIEYKFRIPEILLPRIDYPSMAASIEARSPFMDHKMIEYSAQIPWKIKMKNGPKSILKKISKNKLPKYILDSPKVGFGELLNPFFDNVLFEWFKNDIIDIDCPVKDYVDENFLISLYNHHKKRKNYGFQIWTIYSLNLWMIKNNL